MLTCADFSYVMVRSYKLLIRRFHAYLIFHFNILVSFGASKASSFPKDSTILYIKHRCNRKYGHVIVVDIPPHVFHPKKIILTIY